MNKPQLSLALSLSLVLLQANWLSAQSESGAIWQQMAGQAQVSKQSIKPAATKGGAVKPAASKASAVDASHAMLFLAGKGKEIGAGGAAPAAALTIHPGLPLDEGMTGAPGVAADLAVAPKSSPDVIDHVPAIAALPSQTAVTAASKALLAQLSPDHVVAQADHSTLTAQPIPPVVTGTLDFEEYKVTNVLDLKVSQSRTFKLKNKIVRTSISDPGIAEPVVVTENQLVLLGKAPGTTTLVLWDDAGNSVSIDLRVSRDFSQLQATVREIDPRIIIKTFSVGGSERVLLTGDVDNVESIIKAFAAANVFMDDRGMNIQVANNRLTGGRIGELGGTSGGGGSATGQLSALGTVDRYTFFGNIPNNISKAQVLLSDGSRVTSLVKVRKVPLIVLHCTFMEMNTAAARELATQLGFGVANKSFSFGIGGSAQNASGNSILAVSPGQRGFTSLYPQPIFTSPPAPQPVAGGVATNTGILAPYQAADIFNNPLGNAMGSVNFVTPTGNTAIGLGQVGGASTLLSQAVLLGAPGGAGLSGTGIGNIFGATSNIGGKTTLSINPTFQGMIGMRRARILAEPTLVTISGERASFLAGGEIPIVQSVAAGGTAQQSVVFEPFGIRLNMIPVLKDNGGINLEVSPEERLLAPNLAFTLPPGAGLGAGATVPGFTTRKSQTIVELKPGQELYIAGLVSTNTGRQISKTPVIGEVPVLGALYRSKAFNKNESELVVSIRPEIILPGTPGQLKLPEEIGRVEGPRDTNMFNVEPSVLDERHYTSGRAERHQKTSPTLPEGAPIPDNE
jgi:Flp pilus assembly secretin CpaC